MDREVDGTTPDWNCQTLTEVENYISEIKKRMTTLKKLHESNATVRFGDKNEKEEKQIDIQTKSIKELFQKSVVSINKIEVKEEMSGQHDKMKKNLKAQLVTEMNTLSKDFRDDQRNYIQKLKKKLKKKRKNIGVNYEDDNMDPEERKKLEELQDTIFTKGFTEEQMAQVLQNQRDILQRDRELQQVLSSIVELQDMFKEFADMVIEQGTMIDRIETNIADAEYHVEEGVKYIKGAETVQKYNKITLCLIFVVVAVIAFAVILGIKLTVKVTNVT